MDESGFQLVAVAVDKDKSSQNALKWAVENIVQRGQTISLIHVKTKNSSMYIYIYTLFVMCSNVVFVC